MNQQQTQGTRTLILGVLSLVMVLLCSSVSYATYYKEDVRHSLSFDTTDQINGVMTDEAIHGTDFNYQAFIRGGMANVTGVINGALDFTGGANDRLNLTNSSVLTSPTQLGEFMRQGNWSIEFWVKTSSITNEIAVFDHRSITGGRHIAFISHVTDNGNLYWQNGKGTISPTESVKSTIDINDGSWHHVVLVTNISDLASPSQRRGYMFIDGVLNKEDTFGTPGGSDKITDFMVGNKDPDVGGTSPFVGSIDELRIWSTKLDSDDVSALYNAGAGIDFDSLPSAVASPTIDIIYPEQSDFINEDVVFFNVTVSVDPSTTFANYTIYANGTKLYTVSTTPTNQSFNITDGLYDITAEVFDALGQSATDTVVDVIVDIVNPGSDLLTQIPPATQYTASQNITITALNTNLFGHNLTIYDSLNNIKFSEEYLNISSPQHSIVAQIDATWGAGTYTIVDNASDDHTDNTIPNYGVGHDNANKRISFNTGDATVMVELESVEKKTGASPYTPFTATLLAIVHNKLVDRYTFGFDFSHPSADSYRYTFKVITDQPIIYRPGSGYSGHFVINNKNWLDFEPYDTTVTFDGQYYHITFETTDTEVRFQSIGGVNVGTTISTFELLAPGTVSLTCGIDSVQGSCITATEGQTLTEVYSACSDSTASNFIVYQLNTETLVDSGAGVSISPGNWLFNTTDLALTTGTAYQLNVTCSNDVGSSFTSVEHTAIPVVVTPPSSSGVFGAIIVSGGILLLLLVVIIGLYHEYLRGKKK